MVGTQHVAEPQQAKQTGVETPGFTHTAVLVLAKRLRVREPSDLWSLGSTAHSRCANYEREGCDRYLAGPAGVPAPSVEHVDTFCHEYCTNDGADACSGGVETGNRLRSLSVDGLVGAGSVVVNKYTYTPWGEPLSTHEQVPQPLRYAAREYDAETGLYFVRARYYDPQLGCFVSSDPIGLAGGINPYAYTGDDPVNNVDPLGLCEPLAVTNPVQGQLPGVGIRCPPRRGGGGGISANFGNSLARGGNFFRGPGESGIFAGGQEVCVPLSREEQQRLRCVNNNYIHGPAHDKYNGWLGNGATNLFSAFPNDPLLARANGWTHIAMQTVPIVFNSTVLIGQERALALVMVHEYRHWWQVSASINRTAFLASARIRLPQIEFDAYLYQERWVKSPRMDNALGATRELCPAL